MGVTHFCSKCTRPPCEKRASGGVRDPLDECQTGDLMPGTVLFRCVALFVFLFVGTARAQSESLIEAVRVHRDDVASLARDELEACLAAKCANAERLALITGVLELSEGQVDAAATRLEKVKPPKGLAPFQNWYLGEAQSWSARPALAVKSLVRARKGAPKWLQVKIDRRLAELYVELKQPQKALAILEVDADLTKRPDLLFTRALAREASRQNAIADWKNLALKWPTHWHGRAAFERLQKANAWMLSFDEQLNRAAALWSGGEATNALALLDSIQPPSQTAASRVALLRGQILLSRGRERDEDGQAQLKIAMDGPDWVVAQALATSARRLMRLSDNAHAREVFKQLDDRFPTDPAAEDAGYLAAWLAMNEKQFQVAVDEFIQFEARHPGSKKRDEARWFRGLALVRAERFAEAREVLLSLAADFSRSPLAPQALYWAARSAQQMKKSADGGVPGKVDVAAEYKRVIGSWPGSFYALLSSERLTDLGIDAPLPFTVEPKSITVKRPPALDLAAELARTGLLVDAAQEVTAALQSINSADAIQWGHALQALGEFGAAHSVAARYLWGPVYAQRSPEALALMYPRAFRSSVERWATEYGIEPALVWAIMRRESAFSPEVTSSADARGLLQLIPPTMRGVLKSLALPEADPAQLYSPDWNVRLGAWYLHALIDRLQHPTLVAGAYNGGPNAVVRWARERRDEPLDLWVEAIPYKETRAYVKQVTVDLFIYRQLYGYPAKRLSLEVPSPSDAGVSF